MQQVIQQLRTPLNGARPINRLPPEILSTIFRLAAGPIKTTDLRDVLRLSSICRHWRSIVLDHGAMWSSIRLTGQDPSFVAQQVERCQGVPLHLFINLPPLVFRIEGAPFHARFKQVAPIIRARRCQVQSISAVIGGCRAFRRDLGLDWPNLEELVWVETCPAGSRMHERNPPVLDKDHRLPKLRYLSAKQGLGWEMTSVVSLTALKLEGPMDINLLKFLQATPHLGSMELIKLHIHPLPVGATSIDLPRLTRLVMRNVDYGQLFVRITFLSLKILSVDQVGYQEPVEIIWGKLQVPQTITAVKIEYLETGPDKISINGSNETKTHSLSLTERAALTRSAPMIQALSHTSLTSVTSLSIGRGAPELGVQLPSTSICALISELPRLWRLDLFPSQFTLKAVEYLRGHPLVCPELRILSLTVVRETCEKVFHLLAGLVTDRAKSERWLHRMDCVILRAGGDPRETCDLWDSMSQACKLEKYLRCNGGEEVRRVQVRRRLGYFNKSPHYAVGHLFARAGCRDVPNGKGNIQETLVSSAPAVHCGKG